jgi:hypothetical protein
MKLSTGARGEKAVLFPTRGGKPLHNCGNLGNLRRQGTRSARPPLKGTEMKRSLASLLPACCLVASAAIAAEPLEVAAGGGKSGFAQVRSDAPYGTTVSSPGRFGWLGIGIYHTSISVDTVFGSFSVGDTHIGVNAGGALDILALSPDLPLSVFGNIAVAFGGNFTILPITVGAAVHYDKLPIQLLGGLGLTLMPATDIGETPVGVGLLLMASYPLPQLRQGIAGMAQFQYHFLSDGVSLWVLDVGLTMGF